MMWLLKEFHDPIISESDIEASEFTRFLKFVDLNARLEMCRLFIIMIETAKRNNVDYDKLFHAISDMASDLEQDLTAELLTSPIFNRYIKYIEECSREKQDIHAVEKVGSKPAGA